MFLVSFGLLLITNFKQMWLNLDSKEILPGSKMLMVMLVDEMAKAAENMSEAELKVCL